MGFLGARSFPPHRFYGIPLAHLESQIQPGRRRTVRSWGSPLGLGWPSLWRSIPPPAALLCEFGGLQRTVSGQRSRSATAPASAGLYFLPFAGRRFHETALSDFAPALLVLTALPMEVGAFTGLPLCLESVWRAFLLPLRLPGRLRPRPPTAEPPFRSCRPLPGVALLRSRPSSLLPCTERGPSTGLTARCGADGMALTRVPVPSRCVIRADPPTQCLSTLLLVFVCTPR